MSRPHILIVGAGSAGQRHARNLRGMNCRLSACDPRKDRVAEIAKQGPLIGEYAALEDALNDANYDGFVIASPPCYHVSQTLQVLSCQRKWVMCEKPLAMGAEEARSLEPYAGHVMLSYTYRWWPPIQSFRTRLCSGEIGTVRTLRFVMSAHLEDWHPWERYQDFFMSRGELGGGALLDESHFIDLMLWFLGVPTRVYAQVDKISGLEIDSDDNVDILISYASGIRVNIHLDLLGRPHERRITAVGENGTLMYSYEENAVKVSHTGAQNWQTEPFNCERNEMFIGAAKEFLALISGRTGTASCEVKEGIRTLAVVDACRRSAQSGKAEMLKS